MSSAPFQFNTLVLSGGGVRGVMQLGALQELYRYWCESVRTIIGTSVGGLVGLLLILGYEPREINERFLTLDVLSHFKRERIVWTEALKQKSLFSWTLLEDLLRFACMEKLFYVPTLSELVKKTGKRLVVSTWNLTKQTLEYLSPDTHPDMCVLQALRMTSAIWFVFEKVMYNGDQYMDGSIGDHCPWRYLIQGTNPERSDRVLVLNLPSGVSPVSSTLLQLLLSAVHVNQHQNELMAMSILNPSRTCWVELEGQQSEVCQNADLNDVLSMTDDSRRAQWLQGQRLARSVFQEFVETNEASWETDRTSSIPILDDHVCMSPQIGIRTIRIRRLDSDI
jgi:predicted acylesterase/phospholipase RssA